MSLAKMFSASSASVELENLIAQSEENGGDITAIEGQIDWLASQAGDLATSIDDVLAVAKAIEVRAEARNDEIERLKSLVKRDNLISCWLKNQVLRVMLESGKEKFDTKLHRITCGYAGGIRSLEIVGECPNEYTIEKVVVEPDKKRIREELESGKVLSFAHLLPKQKVLRIK